MKLFLLRFFLWVSLLWCVAVASLLIVKYAVAATSEVSFTPEALGKATSVALLKGDLLVVRICFGDGKARVCRVYSMAAEKNITFADLR